MHLRVRSVLAGKLSNTAQIAQRVSLEAADGTGDAGDISLRVTVNGTKIQGSPFRPEFVAGPVAGRCCTASGAGLHDGVTGQESKFKLQARDSFGNARTSGGDRFTIAVSLLTPACAEMRSASGGAAPHKVEAQDEGDGTYTVSWGAAVAGQYELAVSMERAPIRGSPFRCNVGSCFARPPKELSLVQLQGDGEAPVDGGCEGAAACVVEGQLLALGTKLPRPQATIRRPSAHLCQFPAQYGASPEHARPARTPPPGPRAPLTLAALVARYLKKAAPECRWRTSLLKTDEQPLLRLIGGTGEAVALVQSGGEGGVIDLVAVAEVVVAADSQPPLSLQPLAVRAGRG